MLKFEKIKWLGLVSALIPFLSFAEASEEAVVFRINFEPFIPQFVTQAREQAIEDFEFQHGKTTPVEDKWWNLWGLLSPRQSPFKYPELGADPIKNLPVTEAELDLAYSDYIEEFWQQGEKPSKAEFVTAFALSRVMAVELRALLKFPWLRRERESFALDQLKLRAGNILEHDEIFSRRKYAREFLREDLGFPFFNGLRVRILPRYIEDAKEALRRLEEEQVYSISWEGVSHPDGWSVYPFKPLANFSLPAEINTRNLFPPELNEMLTEEEQVATLEEAYTELLDRVDQSLLRLTITEAPVSLIEMCYGILRYSNYRVIFDLTHLSLSDDYDEIREVPWDPVALRVKLEDLDASWRSIQEIIFESLNLRYMHKIYRKALAIYGQIAQIGAGDSMFPEYQNKLQREPHYRDDIIPYYLEHRDSDYVKSHRAKLSMASLRVPERYSDEEIRDLYEAVVLPPIYDNFYDRLARVYHRRGEDMSAVFGDLPELRLDALERSADSMVRELAGAETEFYELIDLGNFEGSLQSSQKHQFDAASVVSDDQTDSNETYPISDSSIEAQMARQLEPEIFSRAFSKLLIYWEGAKVNDRDLLPIEMVITPTDNGEKKVDIILVERLEASEYESLYDLEPQIRNTLQSEIYSDARAHLVRQIVKGAVRVNSRGNSPWLNSIDSESVSYDAKVEEVLNQVRSEILRHSDIRVAASQAEVRSNIEVKITDPGDSMFKKGKVYSLRFFQKETRRMESQGGRVPQGEQRYKSKRGPKKAVSLEEVIDRRIRTQYFRLNYIPAKNGQPASISLPVEDPHIQGSDLRFALPSKPIKDDEEMWSIDEFLEYLRAPLHSYFRNIGDRRDLRRDFNLTSSITMDNINSLVGMAALIEHQRIVRTSNHRTEVQYPRERSVGSGPGFNPVGGLLR